MPDFPPVDATQSEGTLAGFRLLRKLGIGSRATVYLASGSTGTVALKVFAPEISRQSVGTELDALGRIESAHVVRLVDIASSHTHLPTFVLERVRQGSVATLLRERAQLEAGEAVTLLAPLAGLLPELHRAGIAHGGIGAASVHLGSGGEPVLLGFGHCALFAVNSTIAALDARAAVVQDREALGALARSVLSHVRGAASDRRIRELAGWIESARSSYEFAPDLEARLFDLADSMPVEFARNESTASTVPARIGMPAPAGVLSNAVASDADTDKADAVEPASPHWLPAALLDDPVALVKQHVLSFVRGVRKPLWVVAGGVVLAFVLAIALVPSTNAPAAPRVEAVHPSVLPQPTPSALPDDPVLALPILLRARATCFRDLSILCLDAVDESSSGAFQQDSALIQQIQQGGEIPKAATATYSGFTLVERLGDSALISLAPTNSADTGDPASILVIKGVSGWRIRDLLTGKQATNTAAAPTG